MRRAGLIVVALLVGPFAAVSQERSGPAEQTMTSAAQPAATAPQPVSKGVTIEEAYQREFAFLEAQRRDLVQRIDQTRQRTSQSRDALRAEVEALQRQVVALDSEADRVDEMVVASAEQVQVNADNRDVLGATFQQAGSTLEQHGIETLAGDAFQGLDDGERVRVLFGEAQELVTELSSVRRESGVFYLPDGSEVQGQILKIGNIAAYGQGGGEAGVLAPAGGGRLKVWPEPVADEVAAIMSGQSSEVMPLFLFESLNSAIEPKGDKGLVELVNDGGTIGWIIVVLGVVGVVLVSLRFLFLRAASSSTDQMTAEVAGLVQAGKINEALTILKRQKSAPARVVAAAVRNMDRDRDHIEDIVSESILHESSHLNRFGAFILVIAAVSPLLGLLGTVTGMISTFDVITEFGTGDPKLLAGGIAIALVTTQLGLIVAIPMLILGNMLTGWGESIKDDMEKMALKVINITRDRRATVRAAA